LIFSFAVWLPLSPGSARLQSRPGDHPSWTLRLTSACDGETFCQSQYSQS
jgi:hypothetical protein